MVGRGCSWPWCPRLGCSTTSRPGSTGAARDGGGVRWTTRAQWHVTLRFLGQAPLGAATEALAAVVATAASADVGPRLRRLGRGVLCLPVGGLGDLAGAVAAATGHVGRP